MRLCAWRTLSSVVVAATLEELASRVYGGASSASAFLVSVALACVCGLGGGRVHSLAMWPCWRHRKHLPSFMYCLRSSSESFLKGKEAVASTSIALGSCILGRLCPVFWVGPELLAPGPIRMSLKCWVSILAVFCQSAMFLGMVSLIRQAWYKPRGSPFLKNSMFLGHLYLI